MAFLALFVVQKGQSFFTYQFLPEESQSIDRSQQGHI